MPGKAALNRSASASVYFSGKETLMCLNVSVIRQVQNAATGEALQTCILFRSLLKTGDLLYPLDVKSSWLEVGVLSFQWFLITSGGRLPQNLSSLNALGQPDTSVPEMVEAIQSLTPMEFDELRRVVSDAGHVYFGTLRGPELSVFLKQLHEAHVMQV
jgi:hypothetical protein